jgi:hypothetical protein
VDDATNEVEAARRRYVRYLLKTRQYHDEMQSKMKTLKEREDQGEVRDFVPYRANSLGLTRLQGIHQYSAQPTWMFTEPSTEPSTQPDAQGTTQQEGTSSGKGKGRKSSCAVVEPSQDEMAITLTPAMVKEIEHIVKRIADDRLADETSGRRGMRRGMRCRGDRRDSVDETPGERIQQLVSLDS